MIKDDQFLPHEQFCLARYQPKDCPSDAYTVFRDTWERAREEVTKADRISFVGLSMHPYLRDGLKFLFSERTFPPPGTFLSVGPGNAGFEKSRYAKDHPLTPAGKLNAFLKNSFKHWTVAENASGQFTEPKIDARESFREFIEKDI